VAVVGGTFLIAIGWAHARIHVEHDAVRRTAAVHPVDPSPGEIGERSEVPIIREPLRLEPPIWLVDAACFVAARPPTIQRIARSRPSRSASFTSSYPARRLNTDW